MLGGALAFRSLVASANDRDIAVTVQMDASISATRAHRKYADMFAYVINESGVKVVHPGTDGRSNQWEDQALLNYRKAQAWNLLLDEVSELLEVSVTRAAMAA